MSAIWDARAVDIEAISSKVMNGYVRKKLPDGSFKPESYAFGEGDSPPGTRFDPTIDPLTFMDVAKVASKALATAKYYPTRSADGTDLLILVYWGTTNVEENSSSRNNFRLIHEASQARTTALYMLEHAKSRSEEIAAKQLQADANGELIGALAGRNAENLRQEAVDMRTVALLGYDSWWLDSENVMSGGPLSFRKEDMLIELEEDRYFVVLTAMDYQLLAKKKKQKILWEAHMSIREHGTQFDTRLPGILDNAVPYFGAASKGLQHLSLPEGNVEIGAVKSLGTVSEPATPEK